MTNIQYAIKQGWVKLPPSGVDGVTLANREHSRESMKKWRLDHPEEFKAYLLREYERRKIKRRTGQRPSVPKKYKQLGDKVEDLIGKKFKFV